MASTGHRALAAAAVSGTALALAGSSPAAAVGLLTQPAGGDPTAALVGAVGLSAWAIALWLLLTVAVTAGGHLPGPAGRVTDAVSRGIAPTAVRRIVEVALGLTVSTAVLGAGPAAAAPAPSLDRGAAAEESFPTLDWGAAPAPRTSPASVVVAPGDSLWSLAERDLAARSGGAPTDAAVAAAWPAWWAANREAVGPDPHLLHPGTPLTPPTHP